MNENVKLDQSKMVVDTAKKETHAPIIVMNFTHVYENEAFYKREPYQWVDCTDISGTYGYCDMDAKREICHRIKKYTPNGLHFIDSGNYHYVSEFWMQKIKEPYVLALFDHHTDMMKSRFGDLLSCGSWVCEALDHDPNLKKVLLFGADATLVRQLDEQYAKRVFYYSTESLHMQKLWQDFANQHIQEPIYISVDKDVLSPKEEPTDWDQGTMSLKMLEDILRQLIQNHRIIGVDITGECTSLLHAGFSTVWNKPNGKEVNQGCSATSMNGYDAIGRNDTVNQKLLQFFRYHEDCKYKESEIDRKDFIKKAKIV